MAWDLALNAALKIGQSWFGANQQHQELKNQVNAYNTQQTNNWMAGIAASNRATDQANFIAEARHTQAKIDADYAAADAIFQTTYQNEIINHSNDTIEKNYGIQLDLFGQQAQLNSVAAASAYAQNEKRLDEIYTAANYQAVRNQRNLATAMIDAGYQAERNIQQLRFASDDENMQQAQLTDASLSRFAAANVDVAKQQMDVTKAALNSSQSIAQSVEELRNFTTEAGFARTQGRMKMAAEQGQLQAADEGNRGESYQRYMQKQQAATGIAESAMDAKQQAQRNSSQLAISNALRNSLNQSRSIKMNQFGIMAEAQNAERMADLQSIQMRDELTQRHDEFDLDSRQLVESIEETQKRFGIASNELIDSLLSAEEDKLMADDQVTIQAANRHQADWSQVMIVPTGQLNLPDPQIRPGPGAFQRMPYANQPAAPIPVKAPSFNSGFALGNALLAGSGDLLKLGSGMFNSYKPPALSGTGGGYSVNSGSGFTPGNFQYGGSSTFYGN